MTGVPEDAPARGFFAHHGLWAPGVRLFRRVGFRAKALLISAVFVVPIALLGGEMWRSSSESIAFSSKERVGVRYAQQAMPLFLFANEHRLAAMQAAAAGKSAPPVNLETLRTRLEAVEKELGAELGTSAALKAALEAVAQPPAPGTDVQKVFEVETQRVAAANALLAQVSDGSNLTLDPDLDSYYLMDGAVGVMPALIDSINRLGALAAAGSAAGRTAAAAEAMGDLLDERLSAGLKKVYGALPGSEARLGASALQDEMHRFHELFEAGLAEPAVAVARSQALVTGFGQLQARMLVLLDERLAARVDGMRTKRTVLMAITASLLVLAAYLFYAFFLVTSGGLAEVRRHLEAMTRGDLTSSPSPWGHDEAAYLMLTLRDMQASLRGIVGRVRGSSDSIVHASGEIASASIDLSGRTEKTAANLEESASAMEQLSQTVRETADRSRQAAEVADRNSQAARRSGEVIGEVVHTMRDIHQSSGRIAEIIGVIDGIAFQTNILALNAAVEAARAGEQGRGFAVVATEVRQLAQRSAHAAREIKSLIQSSVERVEAGTQIVNDAGAAIGEFVEHAERMRALMAEISNTTQEQNAGVGAVTGAVQELDRMTQANAALVEESAAAAAALRDQAIGLAAQVSKFRLPEADAR